MEQENVQAQEVVVEQEVETTEETPIVEETQEEEVVTLTKKDFSSMQRKAIAYDATKKAPPKIINNPSSLNEDKVWEIADYIREGYSREDVDFIMRNGGKKALQDPKSIVSIALKTKREQVRAEQEANKLADTSTMSEVERKYTPAQLANMSSAELEKILPHAE